MIDGACSSCLGSEGETKTRGGGTYQREERPPGWNSNPGPSSCEAVVLTNLVGVYIR